MFVRLVGVALVFIGAAGFLAPLWIGTAFPNPDQAEFPLSDVSDVAVGPDKSLFFALAHLGRVQKYDADGNFVRGVGVDALGGSFCLDADADGVNILIARRDEADKISFGGDYLSRGARIDEDAYVASCGSDSSIAAVARRLTEVSVVRSGEDQPTIIKRQPWHYLALSPWASWLTAAVGLALIPEWRRPILKAFLRQRKDQIPPSGRKAS